MASFKSFDGLNDSKWYIDAFVALSSTRAAPWDFSHNGMSSV